MPEENKEAGGRRAETVASTEGTPVAYGENYERLVTIKNEYDPTNLFRLN
jgi:FAD/FMN-containing dehydrogenase